VRSKATIAIGLGDREVASTPSRSRRASRVVHARDLATLPTAVRMSPSTSSKGCGRRTGCAHGALQARATACRAVLRAAADEPPPDWDKLRRDARAALRFPVPDQDGARRIRTGDLLGAIQACVSLELRFFAGILGRCHRRPVPTVVPNSRDSCGVPLRERPRVMKFAASWGTVGSAPKRLGRRGCRRSAR
jgi:hypothetical protein